jgi:hypothetical protein
MQHRWRGVEIDQNKAPSLASAPVVIHSTEKITSNKSVETASHDAAKAAVE